MPGDRRREQVTHMSMLLAFRLLSSLLIPKPNFDLTGLLAWLRAPLLAGGWKLSARICPVLCRALMTGRFGEGMPLAIGAVCCLTGLLGRGAGAGVAI